MEERDMVPQLQEQQPSNSQRPKQHSWMHRIVISVVIIASMAFAIAALLIVKSQGINQGSTILTIISIVVGVVIGLLGLLFAFLQWYNSKHSGIPNPSTISPASQSATH